MMSAATVTEGGYVQLSYFLALNQFLLKKKEKKCLLIIALLLSDVQ